jgi:hypothetical protein
MALRATEGNEKPAGGEDAANEWRVEAGFSTERSGDASSPASAYRVNQAGRSVRLL